MNIDIASHRTLSTAKDNDENIWIAYNRMRGQYASALEHAVPERFFNDPAKCNSYDNPSPTAGLPACPQGISAMKALSLAAAQGQKIYTITKEVYQRNPNIVSSQLSAHSELTRSRIQNALNQGLEVTIHEKPITQDGWRGSGYTMIDPLTGAGAYEIEGGAQGAWIPVMAITFAMLAIVLGPLLGALFVGTMAGFSGFIGAVALIAGVIFTLTQYIKTINSIIDSDKGTPEQKAILINTISAITALVGAIGYFKAGKDVAAAAMGALIGGVGALFQKVVDALWTLF
ncbi:hypothetical protein [Ottowia testudinis]|uniref:Uncharacterized protein n=1 Tax=Ottowia testudinis TaxID=2816950 RepID=A0A975H228_9BURK|nr:hypothetical protein [Ottowia testudinis]QTD43725.1 hypothetical protein J1M35_11185 [Ottowia testudinis]